MSDNWWGICDGQRLLKHCSIPAGSCCTLPQAWKKKVFPSWRLCFHEGPAILLCFCKNEWVRCQTTGSSFQREFSENLFCSCSHGLFCGWLLDFLTKQGSAAAPACLCPWENTAVRDRAPSLLQALAVVWFLGSLFPGMRHGVRTDGLGVSPLWQWLHFRGTLDNPRLLLSSVQ